MVEEIRPSDGSTPGSEQPGAPPPGSKLDRLLETEARLERMIAETRREARAMIEEAEVAADERRGEVEERLDGEAETLRREIEEETRREIETIRADGARRARRFRQATDETIDELATFVVERLASSGGNAP